jgi:hypothetical protein
MTLLQSSPGHHEAQIRAEYDATRKLWQGVGLLDWEAAVELFSADKEQFLSQWIASCYKRMPLDDELTLARIVLFDYSQIPLTSSPVSQPQERAVETARRAAYGNSEYRYFVLRYAHMYFMDMEPDDLVQAAISEWVSIKNQFAAALTWQSRHHREVRTMLYTSFAVQYPIYHRTTEIDASIGIQSSSCERFFSHQNQIKTKGRSRLGRGLLEKLMMITINGPKPCDVDYPAILKVWKDASVRGRYSGVWKSEMFG